jgi:hypothetical protein
VTEKDISPSTIIDRIVEQAGSYAPASDLPQAVRRHRNASDSYVWGIKAVFDKSLFAIIFMLILTIRVPAAVVGDTVQTPKSSDARIEKVKAKVNKIGVRENITVFHIDGKKYHGFVLRIDDNDFEITEVDRKTNYTFQYSEVKKVDEGYGEKGPLGNRVGRRGHLVGLIVALTVGVALPIILVAKSE